jgi:hypothetical protein
MWHLVDESLAVHRDAIGSRRNNMPDRSELNVDCRLDGSRWASARWLSTAARR